MEHLTWGMRGIVLLEAATVGVKSLPFVLFAFHRGELGLTDLHLFHDACCLALDSTQ